MPLCSSRPRDKRVFEYHGIMYRSLLSGIKIASVVIDAVYRSAYSSQQSCTLVPYMYDTVLALTDGSTQAACAVDQALGIARQFGSTVHALYARRPRVGTHVRP